MSRARDGALRKRDAIHLTVEPVGTADERRRRLAQFVEAVLAATEGGERPTPDGRSSAISPGMDDRSCGGKGR